MFFQPERPPSARLAGDEFPERRRGAKKQRVDEIRHVRRMAQVAVAGEEGSSPPEPSLNGRFSRRVTKRMSRWDSLSVSQFSNAPISAGEQDWSVGNINPKHWFHPSGRSLPFSMLLRLP